LKISICPQAKAIPKNKDEKKKEAFKCSSPHKPSVIEVNSHEELMNILLHNAWSPSLFKGYRNNNNFISTDFMTLDIDEGLTIETASDRCIEFNLDHIIMTSPSHKSEAHRFRLIIPLSKSITNQETFEATWNYLYGLFPEIDIACKDLARFYFGGKQEDSFYYDEGELLDPIILSTRKKNITLAEQKSMSTMDIKDKNILEVLYTKVPMRIPESVHFFLTNASTGIKGKWNTSLNTCVFTLSLQGIELNAILTVLESIAPSELDYKDMTTIKGAYKRAKDIRVENKHRI